MTITEDMYYANWQKEELRAARDYALAATADLIKCDERGHHADDVSELCYALRDTGFLAYSLWERGAYEELERLLRGPETTKAMREVRALVIECGTCGYDHMTEHYLPDLYLDAEERQERGMREW